MKHELNVTLILILLFLAAHVVGLFVTQHYLPTDQPLPLNIQKPEIEESTSYIPIFIAILLATIIALVLVKFKAMGLWKTWFFLSVLFTLIIAFSAFIPQLLAIAAALILAFYKVIRPNIIVHNFTEIFIYGGLAGLFVPVLSLFSITILLILISIYDMIAVWKTKHMVSLAKFQSKSKLFAGLFIPYEWKKMPASVKSSKRGRLKQVKVVEKQAILGGGDIGFPLLFSGVVLKVVGFTPALIVSLAAAFSLFLLFYFAEKKKFYPAMPFLTIGCFVGYGIVYLIYL